MIRLVDVRPREAYLGGHVPGAVHLDPEEDLTGDLGGGRHPLPRPEAFAMKVGALSFPENGRPGLVPVLVEIPGNTMAWAPERTGGGAHAQFAVIVRIKDERGREADRLSQEYVLSAAPDKVARVRAGAILFYREADLPPGRYTAEAVAYDALAQTASTRVARFEVPKANPQGLRLSSLMVVGRAEKLTSSRTEWSPS